MNCFVLQQSKEVVKNSGSTILFVLILILFLGEDWLGLRLLVRVGETTEDVDLVSMLEQGFARVLGLVHRVELALINKSKIRRHMANKMKHSISLIRDIAHAGLSGYIHAGGVTINKIMANMALGSQVRPQPHWGARSDRSPAHLCPENVLGEERLRARAQLGLAGLSPDADEVARVGAAGLGGVHDLTDGVWGACRGREASGSEFQSAGARACV